MKKTVITLITAVALAFAIPVYATDPVAQSDAKAEKQQTGQTQTGQMHTGQMITADELQGMEVVSQDGKKIGEIEKVTIDNQSGDVRYVIFSKGGVLGMGKDQVAAPLSAFEIRDDQARLTVDESKLDNVPQQKADATDSDYLRDLETHYGIAPAWKEGENIENNPNNQPMEEDSTNVPKRDYSKVKK